tara:strand:+ start:248 stop:1105 length:858 start_codon:yes stop_codon:yes gene_type:complete
LQQNQNNDFYLKKYQKNLQEYKNIHEKNLNDVSIKQIETIKKDDIKFSEDDIKFDVIYARQDQLAFQVLMDLSRVYADEHGTDISKFLDVGSRIYSMALFANIARCFYLEPRLGDKRGICEQGIYADLNMTLVNGEAQQLPFEDNEFPVITSLHAIEHFGLGRYGDSIDPYGDINGLKEMYRVLKPGGYAILSIPVTYKNHERIVFDDQRLYSVESFDRLLEKTGFKINNNRVLLTAGQIPVLNENDGSIEKAIAFFDIDDAMKKINDKNAIFAYFVVVQKPGYF